MSTVPGVRSGTQERENTSHDPALDAPGDARNTLANEVANSDPVESALADAIRRTTDPAALVALTLELKARREARVGIVPINRKRGAK